MKGVYKPLALVPALLFLGFAGSASSESLKEIYKASQQGQKKAGMSDLNSTRWLPSETEFRNLFHDKNGFTFLNSWIDTAAPGLVIGSVSNLSTRELRGTSQTVTTNSLKSFTVKIMVPHPRYREMMDVGLLEPYGSLIPPKFKASSKSDTLVAGRKATVYEDDLGNCHIVIKSARESAVVLTTDTLLIKDDMLGWAAKLNWANFEEKLNS